MLRVTHRVGQHVLEPALDALPIEADRLAGDLKGRHHPTVTSSLLRTSWPVSFGHDARAYSEGVAGILLGT
jgi:hypothetical protein